jgi:hypothetical protein
VQKDFIESNCENIDDLESFNSLSGHQRAMFSEHGMNQYCTPLGGELDSPRTE